MVLKQSFFVYISIIILVGISTIFFKLYFQPSPINISPVVSSIPLSDSPTSHLKSNSSRLLIVHISGAVKNPGVYEFENNRRLIDAITKAGGALDSANLNAVNLAQKLSDGLKIVIPFLDSTAIQQPLKSLPPNSLNSIPQSKKININYATFNEITSIPGIGPSTAKRIISAREQKLFESLSDLTRVKGIGPKSLKRFGSFISF